MTLATDLQDDIAELLDDPDVGRAIVITRTPAGTYDPADQSMTTPANLTWRTRGLFLNYNDKLIDGTNVKRGDRRLYIKFKGITTYDAAQGDAVAAGSDVYTVITFKRIELGGTTVIFIMQVRK
jgi:hypothetical protein